VPDYQIDSVRKAVAVLRALGAAGEPMPLSGISRTIDLGKATVFRILCTLVEEGLVARDEATKRYTLGAEMVVLGHAAAEVHDIRTHARAAMERLSAETGLPSYLNVAGAQEVVCLEHVASMGGINLYGAAGHTMPYHACPSGLVLLAFGPPERLERVAAGPLPAFAHATLTTRAALVDAVAQVQERGYAVGADDLEDGVSSVAAPIADVTGRVVASLGLAGFSHLFDGREQELVDAVRETAWRLSGAAAGAALGAGGGDRSYG
jgi:IclR family KDG regulon transcriptional repressor